ncbi:MAG: bifunctional phosphoglucose/phosphomannose isomerase [Methanobacteriota archaeon]
MLDDIRLMAEVDKSNMLDVLARFPDQITEAVDLVKTVQIPDFIKVDQVIITGMGASGISGDLIQSLFRDAIDVPLVVNKEFDLPKWANKHTLTVFVSYSGNTEETLNAFKNASQKKCKIIGISSGGKLQELCEKRGLTHICVPGGIQPRSAIAYLFIPLVYILERNRLIKNSIDTDLAEVLTVTTECRNQNNKMVNEQENLAKQIARTLLGTTPQVYGWGIYAPVAKRWRTQFNENSKVIARDDVVPECDHNDIVGWSADGKVAKQWSVLLFRDKDEESLYQSVRLDFMETLFTGSVAHLIEVAPRGKNRLAKVLYTLYLGDFVSCYLGLLRNIDPSPVDAITALKNQ